MTRAKPTSYKWWTQRWLSLIERRADSGRHTRGRLYFRRGAIREITVQPGKVTALIEGSYWSPYEVTIWLPVHSDEEWESAILALAGQTFIVAKLLANEVPPVIEDVLADAGVSLFPDDAEFDCTCLDRVSPCKHIVALFHYLASELDADPFLLFELRGRRKDHVVEALRAHRATSARESTDATTPPADRPSKRAPTLEESIANFWLPGPGLGRVPGRVEPPETPGGVLNCLGPPSLPYGERSAKNEQAIFKALEQAYATVTLHALTTYARPSVSAPPQADGDKASGLNGQAGSGQSTHRRDA